MTYIDDAKVMELISTHAPAGGATYGFEVTLFDEDYYFYSRPCGRGDQKPEVRTIRRYISTHAPAGGATRVCHHRCRQNDNFYSRPCGRGDNEINIGQRHGSQFLLTPLREGRQVLKRLVRIGTVFLLTPLREGRPVSLLCSASAGIFLLTPLREGRQARMANTLPCTHNFYSRPCGRGDLTEWRCVYA